MYCTVTRRARSKPWRGIPVSFGEFEEFLVFVTVQYYAGFGNVNFHLREVNEWTILSGIKHHRGPLTIYVFYFDIDPLHSIVGPVNRYGKYQYLRFDLLSPLSTLRKSSHQTKLFEFSLGILSLMTTHRRRHCPFSCLFSEDPAGG